METQTINQETTTEQKDLRSLLKDEVRKNREEKQGENGFFEIKVATNEKMKQIAKELLLYRSNLQTIKIDCDNAYVTDEAVGYLADALKQLSSLQTVNLNFGGLIAGWLNKKSLEYIGEALKHLSSLQTMIFNFENRRGINEISLENLGGALKHVSSLETVILNFSWCENLNGNSMKQLKKALKYSPTLHTLNLSLEGSATDDVVEHLGKVFKKLLALTTMTLNMKHCKELSEKSFGSFAEGLKRLSSLQSINIDFENSSIDDGALLHMAEALKQLSSLQTVKINFSGCREIGDEGIKHLSAGLQSLKSLRTVELNFEHGRVSNEACEKLKADLEAIAGINHVDVFN